MREDLDAFCTLNPRQHHPLQFPLKGGRGDRGGVAQPALHIADPVVSLVQRDLGLAVDPLEPCGGQAEDERKGARGGMHGKGLARQGRAWQDHQAEQEHEREKRASRHPTTQMSAHFAQCGRQRGWGRANAEQRIAVQGRGKGLRSGVRQCNADKGMTGS